MEKISFELLKTNFLNGMQLTHVSRVPPRENSFIKRSEPLDFPRLWGEGRHKYLKGVRADRSRLLH